MEVEVVRFFVGGNLPRHVAHACGAYTTYITVRIDSFFGNGRPSRSARARDKMNAARATRDALHRTLVSRGILQNAMAAATPPTQSHHGQMVASKLVVGAAILDFDITVGEGIVHRFP